jgi:hypothetical protein
MFNHEAWRQEQQGTADAGLLVSFYYEAVKRDDEFVNIPFIRIWVDKETEVVREVTQEDKDRFSVRWNAFQNNEEVPIDGTPIKELPFATPANVATCKANHIYTAEQLVETPDDRLTRAKLVNFKYQVKDMLASQKDSSHIRHMREEMDQLKKNNIVLQEKIDALLAAQEQEPEPPKRKRGRPRKHGNTPSDNQ